MVGNADFGGGRRGTRWRVAAWSAAGLLLLLPLVAMQFTDDVDWSVADFVFAGVLLAGVGIPLELAVRKKSDTVYRVAVGVGLVGALLLVWMNGAVGIIGSENNAANLMYGGVLAIGIAGSFMARFRSGGMARVLIATAIAQAVVTVVALVARLGSPESGPLEILALNGFFVALWIGSALLFREAARR